MFDKLYSKLKLADHTELLLIFAMEENQRFEKLSLFELLELRAVEKETESVGRLDDYLSRLQDFDTTRSKFVSYNAYTFYLKCFIYRNRGWLVKLIRNLNFLDTSVRFDSFSF